MKRKITKYAGIECGTTAAKLVCIDRSAPTPVITNVYLAEQSYSNRIGNSALPPADLPRHIVNKNGLSGHGINLVAEGATASCYVIQPSMEHKADADSARLLQAKKLLSWEGEPQSVSHVSTEL